MGHVGFLHSTLQRRIVPSRSNLKELKSGWHIHAPSLRDTRELVQVDKRFIFSIGCHLTHGKVLISKEHDIPHDVASRFCDYLTYLLDSPACPLHPYKRSDKAQFSKFFKGMSRLQRLKGFAGDLDQIYQNYFANLELGFNAASEIAGDAFQRELPIPKGKGNDVVSLRLPQSAKLDRAVHVYRQALLSIEPSGQILNYWRALEAVAGASKTNQESLLQKLQTAKLGKVIAVDHFSEEGPSAFNLITRYQRVARARLKELIRIKGTMEGALNFLFNEGRNPSAHADWGILQVSPNRTLSDISKDIILLKTLARVAIEFEWAKVSTVTSKKR